MKKASLAVFSIFTAWSVFAQLPPLGSWRDHVALQNVISIDTLDGKIVAATTNGYFLYDPLKNEIITKTKSSGLSDGRIKVFSKQPNGKVILIGYENGNIDIVQNGTIRNFPDLILSKINTEKTINAVQWNTDLAYVSTNFGIVVVNPSKFETTDTYFPGPNGKFVAVYQIAFLGDSIYAATDAGIRKAKFIPSVLNDFRNWTTDSSALVRKNVKAIQKWGNGIVVQQGDSLLGYTDASWKTIYASSKKLISFNVTNNTLYFHETFNGKSSLFSLGSSSGNVQAVKATLYQYPNIVFSEGTNLWIGDRENGLIKFTATAEQSIIPNGPAGIALGQADYKNETLAIPAGQSSDLNSTPSGNQLFVFTAGQWKNYTQRTTSGFGTLSDFTSAVIDQRTITILVGTNGTGLISLDKDGKYSVQGPIAGGIQSDKEQKGSCRIGGLAFDQDINVWITNPGADAPLVVKKKDGVWKNFMLPFSIEKNSLNKIIVDASNRKWMNTSNGKGLICFDDNKTPDQVSDDRWRLFQAGTGQGNLPSSNVLSMAEDQAGNIWVGTDRGIGIIQCGEDIFSPSKCDASLPIVQQDNFAGLLLTNEIINDIKVDGADRKWIASKNGVWLLSADGQKVIYRFTSSNSKLLSNLVYSIVVDEMTGEVFFQTSAGICSFRSYAIKASEELKKPMVFPNPVPSGYTGTIAIKDLTNNAWVKITELDGRLVYQTRSLGGQAIWNGKNYKGERVSSGVYLLIISNQDNSNQVAGKIFFIK